MGFSIGKFHAFHTHLLTQSLNKMKFNITFELSVESGLSADELFLLIDPICEAMVLKDYAPDIETIWILLVCLPRTLPQRMIFRKAAKRLEYDIVLNFAEIQSAPKSQRLLLIPKQMIVDTSIVCARYPKMPKMAEFFNDFELTVRAALGGLPDII